MQVAETSKQTGISVLFFFFNDTATTEIYTLSLHDALPISCRTRPPRSGTSRGSWACSRRRSEEHTSELQSHVNLVCRLLLEKKKRFEHGEAAIIDRFRLLFFGFEFGEIAFRDYFFLMTGRPRGATLFPYTTLFR